MSTPALAIDGTRHAPATSPTSTRVKRLLAAGGVNADASRSSRSPPRRKRAAGEQLRLRAARARRQLGTGRASIAALAKALADPVRIQLVDVLRAHPGKLCPCELLPLFDICQPTLAHHLKVLRNAGVLDSEKHGLFVYYYVRPGALDDVAHFLGSSR